MSPSKFSPDNWRVYCIVDIAACADRKPTDVALAALQGGADVIQLRHKKGTLEDVVSLGKQINDLCLDYDVPFIINDFVDAVNRVGAAGLHLGQDDLPIAAARNILGPDRLIGKSTHSIDQAREAQSESVDYIGVGPVFATPTKPDYQQVGLELVESVNKEIGIPFVCIGGIDVNRAPVVLRAGGRCVAVVRAICAASDPKEATSVLKDCFLQRKFRE